VIPRIIHQTWKDARVDYWIFKRSQTSVELHLPNWEYRFWTDADLDAFVQQEFSGLYPAWKGLDRHIKRVDTARYCLLHRYGGVYADLDFIFTENIDGLMDDAYDLFFYRSMQSIVKKWDFLGNAFMVSKRGQKFWLDAMDYMFSLPEKTDVLRHTGPLALGAFYASLAEKPLARIFEPDYFDNERCQDGVGARRYGYHVRTATWQHPGGAG
jgi:mannosyltransferase OCH1-like enzyme